MDLLALKAAVLARAGGAATPEDTYDAIRFGLESLGDRHSFLIPPPDSTPQAAAVMPPAPMPAGELLPGGVAYVSIPMMGANSMAPVLRDIIMELDASDPCAWIVDLRENLGGNMWPMLLGIGPVLGEGQVGAFVSPDDTQAWIYEGDRVLIDTIVVLSMSEPSRTLRRPGPPVAVLLGERTVSSGEAIAVAFRGRPNTRSFGTPTAGLSTGNMPFPLSDGAQLNLTVSIFADRFGQVYGGPIRPDVPVTGDLEAHLTAARRWLQTVSSCPTL